MKGAKNRLIMCRLSRHCFDLSKKEKEKSLGLLGRNLDMKADDDTLAQEELTGPVGINNDKSRPGVVRMQC